MRILSVKMICIIKCECGYYLWWKPKGDTTPCVHCPKCEKHYQFYKNEEISYLEAALDFCKDLELRKAWRTHDWTPNQVECPTCLKCGLSPISAHIWGDEEWTKNPIPCKGK